MEIIKKKVCLEDFKSRIPALIEPVHVDGVEETTSDGSWGKIPKPVSILGKEMKYGTLMNLYYSLLKLVINANVLEYDIRGDKWIETNCDWRDIITEVYSPNTNQVKFLSELPISQLSDRMRVVLVSPDEEYLFNEHIAETFGSTNTGLNVIGEVHRVFGKIVTPSEYIGIYVPYFLYLVDVPDLIMFMEALKLDENCCEQKRYEEYGGDSFLDYLKSLTVPEVSDSLSDTVTLDIPLLLTSSLLDMGIYNMYDVDEVIVDTTPQSYTGKTIGGYVTDVNNVIDVQLEEDSIDSASKMVFTSGESKLRTLRKRKISMDDNGKVLPGIYIPGQTKLESPYQIGYVKNIQIKDGVFYGDVIASIEEIFTPISTNESGYLSMKYKAMIDKSGSDTPGYKESNGVSPIDGLNSSQTYPGKIVYRGKSKNEVDNYYASDILLRRDELLEAMFELLEEEYPDYYCYKQDFKFEYELIYEEENEEGEMVNITTDMSDSGTLYVIFDDSQVKFEYVTGAKLREENGKLVLNEANPFKVSDNMQDEWDGAGIWYSETYPLKKVCVEDFLIDEVTKRCTYDSIDFSSKEITYTYDGIDFPRKNYILCNDIRYKSSSYLKSCTFNPVFRDEKMMGLSEPLKESYDVVIDRGSSAAFEKHLQLSELKTWADLENYRNGMFLNK